jgi:aryl-alcohol dehydrogenase-like predicted oxidoreductase
MERRILGKTGFWVSRLGVGLSEIGGLSLTEYKVVADILNEALDHGLNFLDTSACYSNSEELVGRAVAHRRDDYILATKCGHVAGGYVGQEWTRKTMVDSIERSLRRMKTDYIDLVQLHSCPLEILQRGEVIRVLQEAQEAGKTRFIGYSGDNEAAEWAVASGLFDTLQTSFNLVDQRARKRLFAQAKAQNMGIIAKRPIANAAWGASKSPSNYAAQYFQRAQVISQMGPLAGAPENRILLALGFALAHQEIDTAIVGTHNPAHNRANIKLVETQLPIAQAPINDLHARFEQVGQDWVQLR